VLFIIILPVRACRDIIMIGAMCNADHSKCVGTARCVGVVLYQLVTDYKSRTSAPRSPKRSEIVHESSSYGHASTPAVSLTLSEGSVDSA
jgi:hypothetical protein